jgi:hypothetical protein
MWLAIAASVTIQTSAATAKAADDRERVWARAELGAEYDDNVHRAETIKGATDATPTVGSALARGVVSLSTSSLLSHGQDVTFSILGAGKLFLADAARNENVYVVDNAGAWRIATDPRGKIGVGLNYYEATQAGTPTERALSGVARDFRSIVPTLRLARSLADSHTVGLAAGYRWFVYKPLHDYDFRAPVVAVEYRFSRETEDGTADWDLMATAGLELRRFAGGRVVNDPQPCGTSQTCLPIFDPGGARHQDQFITGEVSVTRTGRVLVGAGYAIQWNRSNSLSESLVRHVGIVRLTAPLPLDIYLAARAELVYATYPDGIRLAMGPSGQQSASIEDETRSHLRAELSRNLSDHLQLVGRYSFYANALGNGVGDYRRQTASLSLLYTTE